VKQGQSQPVKSSPLSEGDSTIADFLGVSQSRSVTKLTNRKGAIYFEPVKYGNKVDEAFEDTFKPVDSNEIAKRVADNKKLIQQKIDEYGYLNVPELEDLFELLNKHGYYASGSIQGKKAVEDLLSLLDSSEDEELDDYTAGVARIYVRKSLLKDK
jgi:hypothetical protein